MSEQLPTVSWKLCTLSTRPSEGDGTAIEILSTHSEYTATTESPYRSFEFFFWSTYISHCDGTVWFLYGFMVGGYLGPWQISRVEAMLLQKKVGRDTEFAWSTLCDSQVLGCGWTPESRR